MKNSNLTKTMVNLFMVVVLFIGTQQLYSQNNNSGTISYEKVVNYDLKTSESPKSDRDHRRNAMIAKMPKTGMEVYDLKFDENQSLYSRNVAKEPAMSPRMSHMLERMSFHKDPQAELKQAYSNFEEGEIIEQIEFMTRSFILKSESQELTWQMLPEKKKVLDYVCFSAQLIEGSDTIVAYFTSDIPVSVGPEAYKGLPGAILGIETNGSITMLATEIDLTDLENGSIKKPKDGKKVSQKKFEKIKAEKIKEWKKMKKTRNPGRGDRGNHGRRG